MKRLLIATSLALLSNAAFAIDLGIVEVNTQVSGQPVTLPISVNLEINTTASGVKVDVATKTNLSDLQTKFFSILETVPLPRDNCPGYGQHVLPYLESATLNGSGDKAVFSLVGNADVWDCQKNPIRESVCTSYKEVCFIKCFKVCETLEWRDGSPIKQKVNEGFNANVAFTLSANHGKSIQINPSAASVTPRGDLGKFLNTIAGLFNNDLSTLARDRLASLADKGFLRQTFPPGYESLDPQITSASFSSDASGVIFINTSFTATVPPEKLSEFLKEALKKK